LDLAIDFFKQDILKMDPIAMPADGKASSDFNHLIQVITGKMRKTG